MQSDRAALGESGDDNFVRRNTALKFSFNEFVNDFAAGTDSPEQPWWERIWSN